MEYSQFKVGVDARIYFQNRNLAEAVYSEHFFDSDYGEEQQTLESYLITELIRAEVIFLKFPFSAMRMKQIPHFGIFLEGVGDWYSVSHTGADICIKLGCSADLLSPHTSVYELSEHHKAAAADSTIILSTIASHRISYQTFFI